MKILLYAFALYGAVALIQLVVRLFVGRRRAEAPPVSLLLLVKNQEAQIEGLIRGLYGVAAARGKVDLVAVDFGSVDETGAVLEKMSRSLEGMRLVRLAGETGQTPHDLGLFLCESPIILLLDLRSRVESRRLLQGVGALLATAPLDQSVANL